MKIEFDHKKSIKNDSERALPFELAADIEWDSAHIEEDRRKSYPELRMVGYGYLFGRLHVCCFTPVAEGIRIISFRRANKKEEKQYEKEAADR